MQGVSGTKVAGGYLVEQGIPQSLRKAGGLQPPQERLAGVGNLSHACLCVQTLRGGWLQHGRPREGAKVMQCEGRVN